MNEQEIKELNKKLNDWAGTTDVDYTHPKFGIAYCFECLVPKLQETGTGYSIEFIYNATLCYPKRFECVLLHEYRGIHGFFAGGNRVNIYSDKFNSALALCLAIGKVIDKEND